MNRKTGVPGIGIIVFVNIFCLMIIGCTIGFTKMADKMERYTENWVEVDVTIDDVAFEYDGEDVESDSNNNKRTIYKFHMDRILHYTYNGVDYDVKDERTYESENPDYSVEPRQNYKDEYVYKINPSDPASMSISYTIGGGEGIFAVFDKIIIIVLIIILLVVDTVFLVNVLRRKKVTFEEDNF